MAKQNWTKARLERDLEELHQLLGRAERESRGLPDDIVAEQLLRQLIRRRQGQIRALRRTPACNTSGSEASMVCRRL